MSNLPVEDGEILEYLEELSEISSDDEEFEKLREQKKNLEFENFWMSANNCGKENKKVKSTTTHQYKRQRLTSSSKSYEYSSRDVRRHSRAPSVFNRTRSQQMIRSRPSTHSIYKARKHNSVSSSSSSTHKMRRKRKEKEKQRKSIPTEVCNNDITVIDDVKISSEDDEELELRLELLTSKLNDLSDSAKLNGSADLDDSAVLETVTKKSDQFVRGQPTEEEELRILALKSAMLKSHERRKSRQKLENERPYSPSEDIIPLHPLTIDIDSFMEISPIVSPIEDKNNVDVTDPVDMEISNSPIQYTEFADDVIEVVPMEKNIYPQEHILNIDAVKDEENDEESTLRTMLLSSISTKKPKEDYKQPDSPEQEHLPLSMNILSSDEETLPGITKNLKLALERLKMKHRLNTTKKLEQLELKENARNKLSAIVKKATEQKILNTDAKLPDVNLVLDPIIAANRCVSTAVNLVYDQIIDTFNPCLPTVVQKTVINSTKNPATKPSISSRIVNFIPVTVVDNTKIVLNSEVPRNLNLLEASPMISPSITDTKYIPRKSNFKQSKLITSLKDVMKPVQKLVITLNASESESDVEIKRKSPLKKSPRRIVKALGSKTAGTKTLPEFEKNLDSFLRNIRSKQETTNTSPSPTKPSLSTPKPSSAVKHLPVAQQQEYEKLLNKMKMLEESKKNKQKLRQLKRIKSITISEETPTISSDQQTPISKVQKNSAVTEKLVLNPPPIALVNKKESSEDSNKNKISLYLSKISNLAKPIQKRLLDKSESNYRNHSNQLMEQINNNVELLNANEIEIRKQVKLRSQVQKLEQMMKTYKDRLQQTNDKIKLNYPKIIRSQRDMVQCKSQQQRFSVLCEQVGKTVQGLSYKLPDRQSLQMIDNLKIIAEKNDDILKTTSNPQFCSHIRFLSAKVQHYVTKGTLIEDKIKNVVSVDNEASNCSVYDENNQENIVDIPLTQSKTVECLEVTSTKCPDLPLVNAIIDDINEIGAKDQIAVGNGVIENNNVEPKLPETYTVVPITINICDTVETNQLTLKDVCCIKHKMSRPETDVYLKKLKYDSPLGLLKVNNSNLTDPNAILCPFELMNPGSCQDKLCKMSHLIT